MSSGTPSKKKPQHANCPYCGKPMESGDLSDSGYKMKWRKASVKEQSLSFLKKLFVEETEELGSDEYTSRLYGFKCHHCKKLILSYDH